MDDLADVRLANCLSLFEILVTHGTDDIAFLRQRYLERGLHFDASVEFLATLGLFSVSDNAIHLSEDLRSELLLSFSEHRAEREIISLILHRLLRSGNRFAEIVGDFLGRFQLRENDYRFKPQFEENLALAGVRNFLIELEVIEYDTANSEFVLIDPSVSVSLMIHPRRRVGRKEHEQILEKRQEIGRLAELEVLRYEQNRLRDFPDFALLIEHTAESDVAAGFDIKSFEADLDEEGNPISRFIEVKAVSPIDFQFHWSRNEIDFAWNCGPRYYLYLLPVLSFRTFDTDGLRIIADPAHCLFDSPLWSHLEDAYSFILA
jgi:hypothetical protein